MKYKKKLMKKTLKLRGGFNAGRTVIRARKAFNRVPTPMKTFVAGGLNSMLRNNPKAAALFETATDVIQGVEATVKKVRTRGKDGRFTSIGKMGTDAGSVVNNGVDECVAVNTGSVRMSKQGDASNYKYSQQTLVTGVPSSKVLKRLAKQEGVVENILKDSMFDNVTTTARRNLKMSTGFNQKFQGHSMLTHLDLSDIRNILSLPGATPGKSNTTDVVSYASLLNYTTQFRFSNNTTNSLAKLKIYICTLDPRAATSPYLATAFCINNELDSVSSEGMPLAFQLTPKFIGYEGGANDFVHTHVNPNTRGIFAANYWKTHCKIQKVISRAIQPDEVFTFKHVNECGPGLRWDVALADYLTTGGDGLPLEYFYIFELQGNRVEIRDTTNDINYIGTAPTYLTFEYQHKIKFVQGEVRSPSEYIGNEDGVRPSRYKIHAREFLRSGIADDNLDGTVRRPFNLNYTDFAGSQYSLVTMSDESAVSFNNT